MMNASKIFIEDHFYVHAEKVKCNIKEIVFFYLNIFKNTPKNQHLIYYLFFLIISTLYF